MSEQKREWNLLGLTLDSKVNILALAAFLLSVASLGIHAWQYIEGAKVSIRVGERVNLIFLAHPARPDVPTLAVNARLSYINTGAIGRDAVLVNERLEITFGDGPPYEYRWLHFEVFIPKANGYPHANVEDTAHDFLVPGASAESHQTTFVGFWGARARNPEARTNPLTELDFLRFIKSNPRITLRFVADGVQVRPAPVSCQLVVTKEMIEEINATKWVTALCEEIVPGSGAV